jgi:hypothetical protein
MRLSELPGWKKATGILIVIVFISSFLPWVSVFGISVSGISADGKITMIFSLIAAGVLASSLGLTGSAQASETVTKVVCGLCGLVAFLVGLADMNRFAAIGLWLTMLAGLAWIAVAVLSFKPGLVQGVLAHASAPASGTGVPVSAPEPAASEPAEAAVTASALPPAMQTEPAEPAADS